MSPIYDTVRPKTGVLAVMLERVGNPGKHRWKKYLRACKAIPKESPVHGSTSFRKLNERRHVLIDEMFKRETAERREVKESAEFKALQKATAAWLCGPLVVGNFLISRLHRRIREGAA